MAQRGGNNTRAHAPGFQCVQIATRARAGGNGEVTIACEVRSELANEKLMHNFVTAAVEAAATS